MNSSSDLRTATLHYAVCKDCDRHEWCDTVREARQAAIRHGDKTGHEAYYDSVEVEL